MAVACQEIHMRVKLLYFVSIQLSGNNNELVFCRIGAESPIITPQFSLILLQFSICRNSYYMAVCSMWSKSIA